MRRAVRLIALLALPLAGCGKRPPLRPLAGSAMPVRPATAPRAATIDELLTPFAQSRPDRVDEVLRKSQERRSDRFDLPPPG